MAAPVIRAEGISKEYRLGEHLVLGSLRETLANGFSNLVRWRRPKRPETMWALRDVSFEIEQGEVMGLIGHNGAGKTTLLKILSRITEPTAGRAKLRGRVGSLLEVGTGFHPELTGRENVFLNGAILGMRRAEIDRRFDEIVAFSGVERFLDTPVKRYSTGMYLRLAFAVAAHLETEILLVDEVLAVGDVAFQRKCLGKMGDIAGQGRTVLFVSHNIAAVQQLCTGGMVLEKGRLVFTGPGDQAIERYTDVLQSRQKWVRSEAASDDDDGVVRLLEVEVTDPANTRVQFGDDVTVTVRFAALQNATIAVELVLRDRFHHPVVFLPSGLRFGKVFGVREGVTTVQCTIRDLPLAEGTYYLDVGLAFSGVQVLDLARECVSFEVVSSDPCGTKRSFTQDTRQGSIHLKADFREM